MPHFRATLQFFMCINFHWKVINELKGKNINEVISEGMGKLASMPSGTHIECTHIECTHTGTSYTLKDMSIDYSICVLSIL